MLKNLEKFLKITQLKKRRHQKKQNYKIISDESMNVFISELSKKDLNEVFKDEIR